jgi:hypothetical protein
MKTARIAADEPPGSAVRRQPVSKKLITPSVGYDGDDLLLKSYDSGAYRYPGSGEHLPVAAGEKS